MTQRAAVPRAAAFSLACGLVACGGGADDLARTTTGGQGGAEQTGGSGTMGGGLTGGTDAGGESTGGDGVGGASAGGAPTGGTPMGGSPSSGGAPPSGSGGSAGELAWRLANLTNYESYPDPNSEECLEYNGCTWAGQFAALDGVMSEEWVMEHNIAAVHGDDFATYRLKTLRLRQGDRELDVVVYDYCSDDDCAGCCTENSAETGFLIDLEKYTMQRFGSGDGIVEWVCLDC